MTLVHLTQEATIYLVSECGDPDEEQACLQAVFSTIFEDQLDGWWRDRTTWPTPRSLDAFTRWFDNQFHSMLLDLTDEPLIEEEVSAPARACRSSYWTLRGHIDKQGLGANDSWNSAHPSRGCSQMDLVSTCGAGLFYCFAVN